MVDDIIHAGRLIEEAEEIKELLEQVDAPAEGYETPKLMAGKSAVVEEEQRIEQHEQDVGIWKNVPSVIGQYSKYPNTVRKAAVQVRLFTLPDAPAEKEYAEILDGVLAKPDPLIYISADVRNFHEGRYYVFVTYQKIEYKQIMPPRETKGPKQ